MYEYTFKFKTTEQLRDCDGCPLFNDEYDRCNETWSKSHPYECKYETRLPDCPLEEMEVKPDE